MNEVKKPLTIASNGEAPVQPMNSNFVATIPMTDIAKFCQRWQICELALFGSALRADFGPDSDVDILVTFKDTSEWGLFDHVQMQQELQTLFQREVDLISRRALEHSLNWIRRDEIVNTTQVIYSEHEAMYATG